MSKRGCSSWMIHPFSKTRLLQNSIFSILVIYSFISVTLQIGFDLEPYGAWLVWETVVDGLFLIDVALNFRVGYMSRDLGSFLKSKSLSHPTLIPSVEMDQTKVAMHYLKTWFVLDFLSSLPVTLILHYPNTTRAHSYFKLILMLKLLRLARLTRAAGQLQEMFSLGVAEVVEMTLTVTLVFLYCHLSACIMWFITSHETTPLRFAESNTWDDHGEDAPLATAPPDIAYLACVYWALITFTSVGYGDVTPSSAVLERTWGILNATLSALILGYVVGRITSLIFSRSERKTKMRERWSVLHRYIHHHHLPETLTHRMVAELCSIWERQLYKYNEEELEEDLPAHLVTEVRVTWWLTHVAPSLLFPHDKAYLRAVLNNATKRPIHEGDIILNEGHLSRSLFVVNSGSVEVLSVKWPAGPPSLHMKAHAPARSMRFRKSNCGRHQPAGPSPAKALSTRSYHSEGDGSPGGWVGRGSFGAMARHLSHKVSGGDIPLDVGEVGDVESVVGGEESCALTVGEGAIILGDEVVQALKERKERGLSLDQAFKFFSVAAGATTRAMTEDVLLFRLKLTDVFAVMRDFSPLMERLWEGLDSVVDEGEGEARIEDRDTHAESLETKETSDE